MSNAALRGETPFGVNEMAQTPFEMPQQFRDLAEQNIKQMSTGYGQMMDMMNQAAGAWFGAMPPSAMTESLKTVQGRTAEFAKANGDAAFALAKDVAKAASIQDVFALQTAFAQKQMQALVMQTQELGALASQAAQKASKMPTGM